ncbi:hypothetical protein L6452_03331 [Arctium lappa]|uniref:Uncharacterized protein n=1 Tax=Arctium lappa TaxID=4217 RepID=A0ACB9FLK8_ARCLA|nr:hypothetical protein L6452_03331 [Arctium lappa]
MISCSTLSAFFDESTTTYLRLPPSLRSPSPPHQPPPPFHFQHPFFFSRSSSAALQNLGFSISTCFTPNPG